MSQDWTEHSNYEMISTLTMVQMNLTCSECDSEIDKQLDGLMKEIYDTGDYNMEGWEPKPNNKYVVW